MMSKKPFQTLLFPQKLFDYWLKGNKLSILQCPLYLSFSALIENFYQVYFWLLG